MWGRGAPATPPPAHGPKEAEARKPAPGVPAERGSGNRNSQTEAVEERARRLACPTASPRAPRRIPGSRWRVPGRPLRDAHWKTRLPLPRPAPLRLPLVGRAVGAGPRLDSTRRDERTSLPALCPLLRLLHAPSIPHFQPHLDPRLSAHDVSPRIPELLCAPLLPGVGPLDLRRVPDLLEASRVAGVRAPSRDPAVRPG